MTKDQERREAAQAAWRASAGSAEPYRIDRVIDAIKSDHNPWVGFATLAVVLGFIVAMTLILR